MFLTDLEAHIGIGDCIRTWYTDDCSLFIESVNAEKLSNKTLYIAIDTILQLPNYRNIFERSVKFIDDKEVFVITLKLP